MVEPTVMKLQLEKRRARVPPLILGAGERDIDDGALIGGTDSATRRVLQPTNAASIE